MEGSFLVRQTYEDEITYNLITAAVEVLQIPADAILELFGKTFFEFCQDSGYDKILQVLGATPRDFLQTVASKLHNTEVKVEILKTKQECDHVHPATFCRVFPFHLMFDRELNIIQAGRTVSRLLPRVTKAGCKITDVLDTVRPHLEMTFANVLAHINTVYVLKTKPEEMTVTDPHEEIASLRSNAVHS
ncbi:Soluble guanylyl cyclase beta-1 subunit [Operophtera brumata]|uniref:guanylate cyclase n=1 Tax=Operophtera brumata TaxID=104452 RepID=A0A0L7LGN3_OPEBR|nr:Soluble guanylyl cyclase beta-1 subunit [Operophtera brumata]